MVPRHGGPRRHITEPFQGASASSPPHTWNNRRVAHGGVPLGALIAGSGLQAAAGVLEAAAIMGGRITLQSLDDPENAPVATGLRQRLQGRIDALGGRARFLVPSQ